MKQFLVILLAFTSTAFARDADLVDLTLADYSGFRTMSGLICLGGSSRLVTPSYLTGYRYSDCCTACRNSYNCAGFAIRPSDGVCFAVSSGCTLREDHDWLFHRRIGSGAIQVETPPRSIIPIEVAVPAPTTTPAPSVVDMRWVSFPEFTYVGSHCQGTPLGGREFDTADDCRAFCLTYPSCYGFSIRFDGVCIAKTSSCRWVSDPQWGFYLRSYRAVYLPAPPAATTPAPRPSRTTQRRPLVLVQMVPISADQSTGGWALGWPTFDDFYLMNGHCQGGALQEDYLYSAASCRFACLTNPRCFGFSMRTDGLCLPKTKTCTWTNYPVEDWRFYKLHLTPDDDLRSYVAVLDDSNTPRCNPPSNPCGRK